ncbi:MULTISPECIES: hypothetical protein [unclassified Streptomyces]|uniref:hypothetical protein n=1 Tax=unclassified Streptomyces TaxID=2593676 RepID=UPI0018FF0477|nr:hypothetical protein [Streptomyces sp. CB01373]
MHEGTADPTAAYGGAGLNMVESAQQGERPATHGPLDQGKLAHLWMAALAGEAGDGRAVQVLGARTVGLVGPDGRTAALWACV